MSADRGAEISPSRRCRREPPTLEQTVSDKPIRFPQHADLVGALGARRLLVVVGHLVREAAGLLGPRGLVERGLEAAEFSEVARGSIVMLADRGLHAAALEQIKTRLGPMFSAFYEPLLAGARPTPPASLRALALLAGHMPQVLTTNLDNLVELALPSRWAPLAEATADLASRTEVVFKMLGDARHVTTWRFTQDGLQNATYLAPHFREGIVALLRGHQILFIGYRGDDELLDELLRLRAHAPKDGNTPQWVALVPPGGLEKRTIYGARGLHLVELDVPAEDPVAYDNMVAEYLKTLARAVPTTEIDAAAQPEQTLIGNPYPGLAPFSEAQAGQFFGRGDDIQLLVSKLGIGPMGRVRWLMLTGPSGVGKSSLLAAGLVPAVRLGAPPLAGAPTQWCVAQLRPGRELLRNLAASVQDALTRMGQHINSEDLTREHLLATDRALTDYLAPRLAGRGFLLILDQFEDAFTIGISEDRPHLDALLVRSLQDLEVPFYMVTAMRSDSTGDFVRHFPRMGEQLNRGSLGARHDLSPLRSHDLHEAVVRPAELTGRVFEPGLVDRILREAGAVRGSETGETDTPSATLPLVAHVLHALVEREPGRVLSLRAYEALGGVAEALTRSANSLMDTLRGELFTEAQIRSLLVALIEVHPQGRDTRCVLSRSEALAAAGGDVDASSRTRAEALLLRLSGGTPGATSDALPVRLVAIHGEGEHATVDLVHDALLHEWATLRGWLREDRDAKLLHQELKRASRAWLHQQRSSDELWRGGRLARAAEVLARTQLSADEKAFLVASITRENAEAMARENEHAEKLRLARRNNHRLQALGGVLFATSILAFVQYRSAAFASEEATRAATLAEERLSVANNVVKKILTEALPALDRVPGTADVKKQIHAALEDLQSTLLPDANDDVEALHNRMIQHRKRGELALTHDNLVLARKEFDAEFQLAERLAGRDPNSVTAHRDLSFALIRLGDVEKNTGNLSLARLRFERALSLLERLAAGDPQNASLRRDLSMPLNKLGGIEQATGDLSAARRLFERSLHIREKLLADDPQNADFSRDLSVSLNRLADVEKISGNIPAARSLFERALALREKLVVDDPQNASLRRQLSTSLQWLGDIEQGTGNLPAARLYFARSLAITEELVADDPSDASFRRELTVSLERLGRVEQAAGNLSAARLLFERSLAITEELVTDDPQNTFLRRSFSLALNTLGEAEQTSGNLPAARRLYERSLSITEELLIDAPQSAELHSDHSFSLNHLGEVELTAGNLAAARSLFERSLSIVERLISDNPKDPSLRRDLTVTLDNLGKVNQSTGNLAAARLLFERSLSINQEMVAGSPQVSSRQRHLSIALNHLGEVEQISGNLSGARKLFERSLSSLQKLVADDPQNATLAFDLILSHRNLYSVAAQQEDLKTAHDHLNAADKLLDELEGQGQLQGFARREAVRADVNDILAKNFK